MRSSRTRLSAGIAWGMIPLALWAGLPSTACLCANGQLKLICRHLPAGETSHAGGVHHANPASSCCHSDADLSEPHADEAHADCCGAGPGDRDPTPSGSGVASKAGCKPILTAPSAAPKLAKSACDRSLVVQAVVERQGALTRPLFALDAAELDTGPPLDRVIVFRSLLI